VHYHYVIMDFVAPSGRVPRAGDAAGCGGADRRGRYDTTDGLADMVPSRDLCQTEPSEEFEANGAGLETRAHRARADVLVVGSTVTGASAPSHQLDRKLGGLLSGAQGESSRQARTDLAFHARRGPMNASGGGARPPQEGPRARDEPRRATASAVGARDLGAATVAVFTRPPRCPRDQPVSRKARCSAPIASTVLGGRTASRPPLTVLEPAAAAQ
jgi:hypothetical protein